ncbi:hypothetical protein Gasu2_58010 [Galdieria sulphuraria]|uniref:Uncharacterized protein n=1 Tax=Galdieria sulphuraria TaxID=130081 RepID=M2X989_GALSU|nr:uncharacterized protein Gasu_59900 [Galdieria sulphuraria]EME26372.1 hypothetical protein Gasu_59900 [Galdieria sulphuraria]GJD11674.1 hypothetical protein Gasu2_58010 [Galdieria sulphuraria]|eukprot:XP_005702892.1 hypothetical protein Gasu_59900 [Galdieria sulphuraria]
MRTKRHTSFIPDIGNKISPGSARQSRQRRRKELYRKRGCNKIPRNPDFQYDQNRQKTYCGQRKRDSCEFSSHSSKDFSVEHKFAQNIHSKHMENANRQDWAENHIATTTESSIHSESPGCNQDVAANLEYRHSSLSNLNVNEELAIAQNARMIRQVSCEQLLVDQDTLLSLETPLRGSAHALSDDLKEKLGTALEILDDATIASSSFLLDNYTGQNWTVDNQEQLNDFGNCHSSYIKTEFSSSPCTLLRNWASEDIEGYQAMEERELQQNLSREYRLQSSEHSIQSSQKAKPDDEDLFEVIWQSLFEPCCHRKMTRVAIGEQQRLETTNSEATQSSSPVSRDKKLNFCAPFLRRLYSHH